MKKSNVIRTACFMLIHLVFFSGLFAQKDRKDLESQRKALESQIRSTTEILEKTQKNKTKSLAQLKTLNAQIRQRQNLLDGIQQEISMITRQSSMQEKSKIQAELLMDDLENRLSGAMRTAYFRHKLQPEWIYLLSASSLSQMMLRWVYLRQYKHYVVQQLHALEAQKRIHAEMIRQLNENKEAKTTLLVTEEKNKKAIQDEQKSKESMVRDLGKEEKKLKSQLDASRAKKKKLDDEISRLIAAEASRMNSAGLKDAPETKSLNAEFSANKGKLPWPVAKGLVTDHFGTHPHPVLKGITVQNNGVDIRAEPGTPVKCLFNGTVASVTRIPGYDYMVMVRHGLYFTVYSRLISASVSKGDKVTTGQVLGVLGSEEPELHLEIWQDKNKLDPEVWIGKK